MTKRCKPEKGDILISKCGTIGRTKLVDVGYEFSIFVGLALLKVRKDLINGEYLEQLLNHEPYRVRMEIFSPGSTRKTLAINAIERLQVPLPSKLEQNGIVEVLSRVDLAIEKIDEVIAKTERLKKGLMQKLLTEGIDHKEFKVTEIGKIPKEWQVVNVGQITTKIKRGPSKRANAVGKGIVYLTSDYLTDDGCLKFGDLKYLEESQIDDLNKYLLLTNDLLVNCVNSYDKIGKVAVFTGHEQRVMVGFNNFALTLKDCANPHFVKYILLQERFKNFLRGMSKAAVQQVSFSSKELLKVRIPLPPTIEEQQRIVEVLSSDDEKLDLERKEKFKFERIKQGLMNLLLTGQVRVKGD